MQGYISPNLKKIEPYLRQTLLVYEHSIPNACILPYNKNLLVHRTLQTCLFVCEFQTSRSKNGNSNRCWKVTCFYKIVLQITADINVWAFFILDVGIISQSIEWLIFVTFGHLSFTTIFVFRWIKTNKTQDINPVNRSEFYKICVCLLVGVANTSSALQAAITTNSRFEVLCLYFVSGLTFIHPFLHITGGQKRKVMMSFLTWSRFAPCFTRKLLSLEILRKV